ncbi:MAG: WcaF family extracellular polysaccharide biosynthesis acetyltransferase [Acidobacteriota bacterium]|nr:WcaF family extracellular polysaccharide biosynthesis acetyltransferase [Acidobacteriota bacterium]
MSQVHLRQFDNSWYQSGRSRFWQAAWFFFGLPLLRSSVIPSSSLRVHLLRLFGACVGEGVVVKPGVRVKYPWRLKVGNDCWLGEDCWIDNLAAVEIGHDVCVSQGAYLCTGNHDWSDPAFGLLLGPIVLGDGCWVGARSVVAPNVTVGDHAIAAAGSVVTKNIPSWKVYAGNPAVFVRNRSINDRAVPSARDEVKTKEFAL